MIVGCCIKFVDTDLTLRNILVCSRDTNEILKHEILKQALLKASPDRLVEKRAALWTKLLGIDEREYREDFMRNKLKS